MNLFEAVKTSVTTRQVAEYYGLKIMRNGMAACPFHQDKHPSMKVDGRFHCFGCGANGDVIDYVAKMFGLRNGDAAMRIASDFGISYDNYRYKPLPKLKKVETPELRFRRMEKLCFRVLSDYYWLLKLWKRIYTPVKMEDEPNPLFVEALQEITKIEYQLDILLYAPLTDRVAFITDNGERILEIEGRMEQYHRRTTEKAGTDNAKNGADRTNETENAPQSCR